MPIREMMLAVISRAIDDYVKVQRQDDTWRSAEMFLFSNKDQWAAHRQYVCDIADVDVGYVQRMARRREAEEIERRARKIMMRTRIKCNGGALYIGLIGGDISIGIGSDESVEPAMSVTLNRTNRITMRSIMRRLLKGKR